MTQKLRRRGPLAALIALSGLFVLNGATCTNNPGDGGDGGDGPDNLDEILAVLSDDHVEGSADAPVTVVEYADFQCPFCGEFARDTLPTIRTEYIETGKVRWVFRHFPLRQIHVCAEAAARGSECANDQSLFVEFHDRLFNNQSSLCNADLKTHAAALGMNTATFNSCLDSGEKSDRVQRDLDSGIEAGVTATPSFYINGELTQGSQSVAQMRTLLNTAIAESGG